MSYTLKIENKRGEQLSLMPNANYVAEIRGLESLGATINTSKAGLMDGSMFNSSSLNERAVTVTIEPQHPVEANRLKLYRFFQVKQYCKIYYTNGSRNIYIEGWVEQIENDLFTQSQAVQVSIICPQPFLSGLYYIAADLNRVLSLFQFPFSIPAEGIEFSRIQKDYMATITNKGDAETGVEIVITAMGDIVNPVIYNADTGGSFGVNITMEASDQIRISTVPGDKWVKFVHNGVESNCINKVMPNPEWFVLAAGDNIFTYSAADGVEYLAIYFQFKYKYLGV